MDRDSDKAKAGALAAIVGRNLHGLRVQRDLTLEGLSRLCGVSRAMLWQIERARSAPTITVLSRVADALGVSVGTFLNGAVMEVAVVLRRSETESVLNRDDAVSVRALFPQSGSRSAELHELRVPAGAVEQVGARREGTYENVVVAQGSIEIELGAGTRHALDAGDAIYLRADTAHAYRNSGPGTALLYRVTLYPSPVTYE